MHKNIYHRHPVHTVQGCRKKTSAKAGWRKKHSLFLRGIFTLAALIIIFHFKAAIQIPFTAFVNNHGETASNIEGTPGIHLQVETVFQNPQLPNGCEATSLCAALNYFGFPADKEEIAYDYLPRDDFTKEDGVYYAPDPAEKYAGDPATSLGFYCFEKPILQAANSYLQAQASSLTAVDISGADGSAIKKYLKQGMPVVFWCTIDYSSQAEYHTDFQWYLPSGSVYIPYNNLHCILVTGYDSTYFTVCDPLEGQMEISQEVLLQAYTALGSHAVSFEKAF